MTLLTKDQESRVLNLIPELGFLQRLCKEIIAMANALDTTQDEVLIAMRRRLLTDQVTLLAMTFKTTEQWFESQRDVAEKLTAHYGQTIMKEAERFMKLSDPSITLDEKIDLVREYHVFHSTATLEHGATQRIEQRDDRYWFDGIEVDQYFSTFVTEYHPLVRALAVKHNRLNDLAKLGFEHRFRIVHQEQALLVELVYIHVFTAVQVARQVPHAPSALRAKGVDLDRLSAFVEAHIRGDNLAAQAMTLLAFEPRKSDPVEA